MASKKKNHPFWAVVRTRAGALVAYNFPFDSDYGDWRGMATVKGAKEIYFVAAATPHAAAKVIQREESSQYGVVLPIRKTHPKAHR